MKKVLALEYMMPSSVGSIGTEALFCYLLHGPGRQS